MNFVERFFPRRRAWPVEPTPPPPPVVLPTDYSFLRPLVSRLERDAAAYDLAASAAKLAGDHQSFVINTELSKLARTTLEELRNVLVR